MRASTIEASSGADPVHIRKDRLLREMPPAAGSPFATLLGCAAGLAIVILVVAIGGRAADPQAFAGGDARAHRGTGSAAEQASTASPRNSPVDVRRANFEGAASQRLTVHSLRERGVEASQR
jgi:hypothetical protein